MTLPALMNPPSTYTLFSHTLSRTGVAHPRHTRPLLCHLPSYGTPYCPLPHIREEPETQIASNLLDDALEYEGNLAWTVDFATAFALRHMQANRQAVVDAIEEAALLQPACSHFEEYPYLVFDLLDKTFFDNKLKDMVYLEWYSGPSSLVGQTSAPKVIKPRITIQLNRRSLTSCLPEEVMAHLIHQMVHAYLLVCCGPETKEHKRDGRLLDGLHFGVLLYRIKELVAIAGCVLPLSLHRDGHGLGMVSLHSDTNLYSAYRSRPKEEFAPTTTDDSLECPTQLKTTHCSHDSRVTPQQCKDWTRYNYQKAIDEKADGRGNSIMRPGDSELKAYDRLKECPPSSEYVELLWNKQRVLCDKEKAVKNAASMKKYFLDKDREPIKIPECSYEIFLSVHNFLQKGKYKPDIELSNDMSASKGPVLLGTRHDSPNHLLADIRLHKIAGDIKCDELQAYALARLNSIEFTHNDPIEAFSVLYNDDNPSKKVHEDLRRWTRTFLTRTGLPKTVSSLAPTYYDQLNSDTDFSAASTIHKLKNGEHAAAYARLYLRNSNFKEDVDHAHRELMIRFGGHDSVSIALSSNSSSSISSSLSSGRRPIYTPRVISPLFLPVSPHRREPALYEDSILCDARAIAPPRGEWTLPGRSPVDGRWETRNLETGERRVRMRMSDGEEWVPCVTRGVSLLSLDMDDEVERPDIRGRRGYSDIRRPRNGFGF